jgi:MoxR-like ATPase
LESNALALASQPSPDDSDYSTRESSLLESNRADRLTEGFARLLHEIGSVGVAPERTTRLVLLGLFAQGHVLGEDRPGVGKTLLAKSIGQAIDATFTRI